MVLKYEDLASRPSEQLAGIEERFNVSLGSKEVEKKLTKMKKNWKIWLKTLPEAQRTQGIESITQIIPHGK